MPLHHSIQESSSEGKGSSYTLTTLPHPRRTQLHAKRSPQPLVSPVGKEYKQLPKMGVALWESLLWFRPAVTTEKPTGITSVNLS